MPIAILTCFCAAFWTNLDAAGPLVVVIPYFLIAGLLEGQILGYHMLASLLGFIGAAIAIHTIWSLRRNELKTASALLGASALCFVAISQPIYFSLFMTLPLFISIAISLRRSSVEA